MNKSLSTFVGYIAVVACSFWIVPAAHAQQAIDTSYYPRFSWDKIPVAAFVGKSSGPLTDEEIDFLGSRFQLLFLSNAHNIHDLKTTEAGITADAERVKKKAPALKVFFYWNTFIDYAATYAASKTFAQHPEWALRDTRGELVMVREKWKRYDHSEPALREWWSSVASDVLKSESLDGVFIDAVPQIAAKPLVNSKIWGEKKQAELETGIVKSMQLLRNKTNSKKLVIYNGMRGTPGAWTDGGSRFLDHTDGAMVEHFVSFDEKKKETTARDIELITEAGKKGKIVIVKGWPEFNWLDSAIMQKPYEEQQRLAKEQLLYPLACYLIAAQRYSYFCYSWGYRERYGTFTSYDEFDRPLGTPKGDAKRDQWTYTREFEHATVTVDLEKMTASINFKKQ